jgi:hypothetical protein
MDQPTGDSAPEAAPAPARRPAAPPAPGKSQKPLFIGLGVGLAVLIGVGLYLETPREVGKLEKVQVDETDFGKLKARTLREIGSFEAELSSMQEDTQRAVRPLLTTARQGATSASNMEELEKARAALQSVRSIAGGKTGLTP